jgi:hypothetical protein
LLSRRQLLRIAGGSPLLLQGLSRNVSANLLGEDVTFTDITERAGLGRAINVSGSRTSKKLLLEEMGCGVALFDYDNDGWLDIFLVNGTTTDGARQPKSYLFRNNRDGTFTDVTLKAGLNHSGWGQACCVGDFDNDGWDDLFVSYWGRNVLYRNNGDGTFTDISTPAGLADTGNRWGAGCCFLDFDRDGHLDLFVANYVQFDPAHVPAPGSSLYCRYSEIGVPCGPQGLVGGTNLLYRNHGDGTFEDVSEKSGISNPRGFPAPAFITKDWRPAGSYGMGAASADFDNDGWPDIYVACDMTRSLLFHNLRNGTFEERGVEAGVALNYDGDLQAGMGIAVADYDGDGFLDIAKTNFSGDLTSLYHNDDGKFFTDISREAGLGKRQLLGWGTAFVDVDDDGWRDLVIANGHVYPEVEGKSLGDTYLQPTVLFHNEGAGKFRDVTGEAGPGFQTPRSARGLAFGDLDGDGRPEIVLVNMNATPSVLKNNGPHGNHLNISLTGKQSNRSAVGARVVVTAAGHKMIDEVMSGGSYYSQNSFTLHFGLGGATEADEIEIRWPSGTVQTIGKTRANQTIKISENGLKKQ